MSHRDWDQHDYRGTVRRREDYDEGWDHKKRRRYDDYDAQEDTSYRDGYQQEDPYGQYGADRRHGADDDDWRTRQDPMEDDSYQYQHKGYSKAKKIQASEASQHVIFLGLDPDFVESDMLQFLRSYDLMIENVTIIRDRNTGNSRSFGFAQFPSIQEAQKFVEPNFPFVNIPPPQSHGASAARSFADGSGLHLGKRVKIDYSQSAQAGSKSGRSANDGTRDIGNSATPVVLLRGLDPMTSLDSISEALRSSAGAAGQGAIGMKRIVLIRDRYTAMGVGLAFVEFVDEESAGRLLAAILQPELHPEGFRIWDRPVAASFASLSSFQPLAPHSLRDEGCIMGSIAMGGKESVFAKYWDESTVVLEKAFEVAQPPPKTDRAPQLEKKKKKKNKEEDSLLSVDIQDFMMSAIKPEIQVSTSMPTSIKPITFSLNKGATSGEGRATGPRMSAPAAISSAFTFADPDELEPMPDNKPLDKAMTFRKVAPMIASKKVATSINKWNEVSHELRSGPAASSTAVPVPAVPTPMAAASSSSQPRPAIVSSNIDETDINLEYCIVDSSTCYLCSRQLKSQEQLKRHVKESDLHKKNLENETLRQTAKEKIAAKLRSAASSEKKTVYRDRASERRIVHGQPDMPLPEAPPSSSSGPSRKIRDVPLTAPAPPPPPPKEPAKDENNVGNKLLKKMGWSEGTGLGLSGDGRVDPIQTAMYASGAGLGASKGKDITNIAGLDYAGLAKESARERFEQ